MRFWLARMFVSRCTSARIHSFVTASRVTRSRRSSGSDSHTFISSPIVPEPRRGMLPPIEVRSFMRVVSDTRQPSPGLPSISSLGMRVSVKYTSLNSASPVI